MTKRERRQVQLERHYAALVRLAEACGVEKADGKKLSVYLLKQEQEAHKKAEDYCNGLINSEEWEAVQDSITERVQKQFNNQLVGFFVNGDPRGCALKIDDAVMRSGSIKGTESRYATVGISQDWGGYGLLAPEITGD